MTHDALDLVVGESAVYTPATPLDFWPTFSPNNLVRESAGDWDRVPTSALDDELNPSMLLTWLWGRAPNHLCLPINYAWDRRVSAQILSSFPLLTRRKWSQPELLGATGLLRGATGAHARALPGATTRYQTMARGYEGTIRGTCLRGYHGYLGYQALCPLDSMLYQACHQQRYEAHYHKHAISDGTKPITNFSSATTTK
ncbi:hypothetical protein B0H13DRAFT_1854966 [Mycena leptocephala]|nr:hypothetical protein B0H13DRAFT_1854966 [Mycena leptocephala]